MNELAMMNDEELLEEIEKLDEESDEAYKERNLEEYGQAETELEEAIQEAKDRGYKNISQMKEQLKGDSDSL